MWRWLTRILGGRGESAAGERTAPVAPARPEPEPQAPLPEGIDPAFAPYARALGVVPTAPLAPADRDEEEDRRVAALVVEHFRRNRPRLASAPSLSLQILSLVSRPDACAADLVPLVQNDPALAAAVLRVANSSFHRAADPVEGIRDAVVRLGVTEAGRVAGGLAAKSLFSAQVKQELAAFSRRWADGFHRAVTVATVSAGLAMKTRGARADRAYMGGILVDAAKSVALRSLHALMADGHVALDPADARVDRVLELVHVEVGAEMHEGWNLPGYLVALSARHHDDAVPDEPELRDLHVVRLVSALEDLRQGPARAPHAAVELVQSAGVLGVSTHGARALLSDLRTTSERVAHTFAG